MLKLIIQSQKKEKHQKAACLQPVSVPLNAICCIQITFVQQEVKPVTEKNCKHGTEVCSSLLEQDSNPLKAPYLLKRLRHSFA